MLGLVFAALCAFFYVAFITLRYGLPRSLSATYYTPDGHLLFVPLLLYLGVVFTPVCFVQAREGQEFWVFLFAAGLAFVAATPLSRDAYQGSIHLGAALIAAFATQGYVAAHEPHLLCLWFFFFPLWLWRKTSAVLWAEIICFLNLFLTLFLRYAADFYATL